MTGPLPAADPARPHFEVSVFPMGPTGGSLKTAELVEELNAADWCTAAAAPAAERWNRKPGSVSADAWASVVLTGFGDYAHAFVFLFNGPNGSARLAAHIPYGVTWVYNNKTWVVPADRIAAAFREFSRQPPPEAAPAVVCLQVTERAETDTAAAKGGSLGMDGMTPVKRASTVTAREALPCFEAMIAAALCENGWAPSWDPKDPAFQADVRFGFQASSVRLTPTGSPAAAKENIPEERYYEFLRRLAHGMAAPKGTEPGDFALLGRGSVTLLAAASNRVCVSSDIGLAAFNPRTGNRLYPAPDEKIPERPDSYIARPDSRGERRLFRISGGLASADPATRDETLLARAAPAAPWSFAAGEDGLTVVATDDGVTAFRDYAPAWSMPEASPVSAGPAVAGDRVYAATVRGSLFCRQRGDGRELWRQPTSARWSGEMVCLDNRLLAFDRNENVLWALDPENGTVLWKQALGDVPLKAPARLGGKLLVAAKNNRLLLLNPADGTIAREIRWPTWLSDVLPIETGTKSRVACSDIHGRVSLLDGATLEPARETTLPARAAGEMLFAPLFPTAWGPGGEEEELGGILPDDFKPAVLVLDKEGFCYILPIP